MTVKTILRSTRPAFLILAPVCVLLGVSTSWSDTAAIDYRLLSLIVLGAVTAHISVNTFNEYVDFKSGLDLQTVKTPFSGGSGALPDNPGGLHSVLMLAIVSLVVTVLIGLYFVAMRGMLILPVGVLGVLLVLAYTPWINRWPLFCLIAPGLGFGTLMVVGTDVMLTADLSLFPWVISLVPFFLINNLLLLNQYPDLTADAQAGRKTFPIVFGLKASNWVYGIFMMAAYLLILLLIQRQRIPELGYLALLPMGCSIFALYGAIKHTCAVGHYPRFLAANVAAAIFTPLLISFALFFG